MAGDFVCPWCGATFPKRHVGDRVLGQSLEEHWQSSPECRSNRNVNNPTQTKYERPPLPRLVTDDEDDGAG